MIRHNRSHDCSAQNAFEQWSRSSGSLRTSSVRQFRTNFKTTGNAAEYAANVERCNGATNVARKGKAVTFEAPTHHRNGESALGDLWLTANEYGGVCRLRHLGD